MARDVPFSRRGQTTSSSGTNEVLVGDKRDPRGGQTRTPSGTNDNQLGITRLQPRPAKGGQRVPERMMLRFFKRAHNNAPSFPTRGNGPPPAPQQHRKGCPLPLPCGKRQPSSEFTDTAVRQYSAQLLMAMSSTSSVQNALMKALARRALVMSGMLRSMAARRIL